ncbi:VOC family protein [Brevibacillus sp. SYSU BS000544]|uniref:VOC family protein n=1 Tax=Brevibacillus sp. SYSU BS000544 TaxID=3416443 RepID=UPI003CE4D8B1
MKVKGFNHVTILVSNLQTSLAFYTQVLQMKLAHQGNLDCYLEWGSAWVCLIQKEQLPRREKTAGVDHVAFTIAEEDFDEAVSILQQCQVTIVRGPIDRGLGRSINFLDPDGTELELHTSNLEKRMQVWK